MKFSDLEIWHAIAYLLLDKVVRALSEHPQGKQQVYERTLAKIQLKL